MAKRVLLQPNVVYIRVINPTSDLSPTLQIKGGIINVYNYTKTNRSQPPPTSKDVMILDEISPIEPATRKVGGMSDFLLYEVVSGNPRVVGMNLVEALI